MSARLSDRACELAQFRTTARLADEIGSASWPEFDPGYRAGMALHNWMSASADLMKLSDAELSDAGPNVGADVRLTLAVLCARARRLGLDT